MLAVHPEVAKRVMEKIDAQCSIYYIVIGSVYNLAQSAMVDAMPYLKTSKWWKHEVKRDANLALRAYDVWNQKMKLKLWDRYQLWLDASDAVADKISTDIDKLRWSYDAALMKRNEPDHMLKAYLLTAVTMNDIAQNTFAKFLDDGSKAAGIDMRQLFRTESSFDTVKVNWEKAVSPILRCSGSNINCNDDSNCILAADIICRKLTDLDLYDEACQYGASLNVDTVNKYTNNNIQ